jgi:hypothetical protein
MHVEGREAKRNQQIGRAGTIAERNRMGAWTWDAEVASIDVF